MDCQVVLRFLQVYLDGEFDDADRSDLEEHLGGCPACRAQAEYERRFRQAIKARIPLPEAPLDLRARVQQAMAAQPLPRRFPRPLVWGTVPAVAALALIVTFTWTVTSGFSPLVDDAVLRHSSEPPVEVNSQDSGEVENWFKAKVDFNVSLPRFHREKLALVGARLSNLAERQAAMIRYRSGGRRFSLFVITDSGEDLGSEHCRRVRKQDFCTAERRGYSVVSWRSRGLVYSMVADTPTVELVQMVSGSADE